MKSRWWLTNASCSLTKPHFCDEFPLPSKWQVVKVVINPPCWGFVFLTSAESLLLKHETFNTFELPLNSFQDVKSHPAAIPDELWGIFRHRQVAETPARERSSVQKAQWCLNMRSEKTCVRVRVQILRLSHSTFFSCFVAFQRKTVITVVQKHDCYWRGSIWHTAQTPGEQTAAGAIRLVKIKNYTPQHEVTLWEIGLSQKYII